MVLSASQHAYAQKYIVQLLSLRVASILNDVLPREGKILAVWRMVGNQACRCKRASQGTHMATMSGAKGHPSLLCLGNQLH